MDDLRYTVAVWVMNLAWLILPGKYRHVIRLGIGTPDEFSRRVLDALAEEIHREG